MYLVHDCRQSYIVAIPNESTLKEVTAMCQVGVLNGSNDLLHIRYYYYFNIMQSLSIMQQTLAYKWYVLSTPLYTQKFSSVFLEYTFNKFPLCAVRIETCQWLTNIIALEKAIILSRLSTNVYIEKEKRERKNVIVSDVNIWIRFFSIFFLQANLLPIHTYKASPLKICYRFIIKIWFVCIFL